MSLKTKQAILLQAKALNLHPEKVHSALFQAHQFFDPHDQVQVKYEMLRAREAEGVALSATCAEFGFSRESYRHILTRFSREGMAGLFEHKRGRKGPVKATQEVRAFIRAEREKEGSLSVEQIIHRCHKQLGVIVSSRTVYRILEAEQKGKKKRRTQ
jgi:transposase